MSKNNEDPKKGIPSPFSSEDFTNRDEAHEMLIADLEEMLEAAKNFEFHDFKNSKHPAPKVALVGGLNKIIARVMSGWYDNKDTA